MPKINRWRFAVLATVIYALIALIPLSSADWDISHFIVAGRQFVNRKHVASPIQISKARSGYDGQFYYRLAVDPDARTRTAYGVTFDAPAWRMQRIGYPLLAHVVSLGRPALVPLALFLINLFGIGLIAFIVKGLQERLRLPAWLPWAVLLWPGLVVTLTHDTTEILALVLLSAAMTAYLSGRTLHYAILAALTCLTRETAILLFAGIALYEGIRWLRVRTRAQFCSVLASGLVFVPFLIWRELVTLRWGISPQQAGGSGNIGIPFGGMAQTLAACFSGEGSVLYHCVMCTAVFAIVGTGVWTAVRLPALWRRNDRVPGLLIGWGVMAALLSTMTAAAVNEPGGPWVDTSAAFRAYSEYWLITMVLLAVSGVRVPRWAAVPAFVIWGVSVGVCIAI